MKSFKIAVLFLGLAVGTVPVTAAEAPASPTPAQLSQAGAQLLTQGDFDRALAIAMLLLQNNPRDTNAHHLRTLALHGKGDLMGVIQAVVAAEAAGIRNASLYQKQAEAFYLIQAYEPCLQALAKIEELAAE